MDFCGVINGDSGEEEKRPLWELAFFVGQLK